MSFGAGQAVSLVAEQHEAQTVTGALARLRVPGSLTRNRTVRRFRRTDSHSRKGGALVTRHSAAPGSRPGPLSLSE